MTKKNSWLKECFNTKGRWNRKKFWLYPLGFMLITLIFMISIIFLLGYFAPGIFETVFIALVYIWYIPMIYVSTLAYIKRFRDLNKNPWMTVLTFVPIVGIAVSIYAGFWKGTVGENKYGPDPLGGTVSEKAERETSTEQKKTEEL